MSGRAPKQKGDRLERSVVHLLQNSGLTAKRVPLSGASGGCFSGDVIMSLLDRNLTIECKSRANAFHKLYDWLNDRDALVIKADRKDALCVLRLRLASEIAIMAEKCRSQ